jgi:hypothetical protein
MRLEYAEHDRGCLGFFFLGDWGDPRRKPSPRAGVAESAVDHAGDERHLADRLPVHGFGRGHGLPVRARRRRAAQDRRLARPSRVARAHRTSGPTRARAQFVACMKNLVRQITVVLECAASLLRQKFEVTCPSKRMSPALRHAFVTLNSMLSELRRTLANDMFRRFRLYCAQAGY